MIPAACAAGVFVAGLALGCFLTYWWNEHRLEKYGKLLSFTMHEVNTPLTSLHMTVLNFLQGVFGPLPKEHGAWMSVLSEQTIRMGYLLGDARDLLHLKFHRDLRAHPESLSLNKLLAEELSHTKSSFGRAGIEVDMRVPENLPDIQVDKDQMQRLISGLLANARKFQSGGRVFLSIQELPPESGASTRFVGLEIGYKGPKMAPDEAQRVLDLFYPTYRRKGSEVLPCVGLGLGFCRILAELQGGALSLQVDDDGTSRIRVRLPVASVSGTIS